MLKLTIENCNYSAIYLTWIEIHVSKWLKTRGCGFFSRVA